MLTNKVKTAGHIILIPCEDIRPSAYNIRRVIAADEIRILSESIRENGILVPLTVSSNSDGTYNLISGERRRQAAILADMRYLPCILMDCSEIEALITAFIDNFHRKELHFLESAQIAEDLRELFTIEELSELTGIPTGVIYSRIRLLNLPDNIKWKIITSEITESTANLICNITDSELQNAVTDLMISNKCSFEQALEIAGKSDSKTVFIAHYNSYTIFKNTIEHAVETMTASGFSANISQNESAESITYKITINKLI